jgi:transcriptional regulator with XRE-family HTH domain
MSIALRFKEFRSKLNLSQKKLAESLNIRQSSIGAIEKGKSKPSLQTLQNLLTTHHLNANWLLSGQGPMLTTQFSTQKMFSPEDIKIMVLNNFSFLNILSKTNKKLVDELFEDVKNNKEMLEKLTTKEK